MNLEALKRLPDRGRRRLQGSQTLRIEAVGTESQTYAALGRACLRIGKSTPMSRLTNLAGQYTYATRRRLYHCGAVVFIGHPSPVMSAGSIASISQSGKAVSTSS